MYKKEKRNTVNRYKNRGVYDLETVHSIVNTVPVVHVSFKPTDDDPFPALLPMIGHMCSYESPDADLDEPLDLYLHGYVSARMMRMAGSNETNGVSNEAEGLPVTICATSVDGIVLALTPNANSYNYRSAVIHGYAVAVEDVDEKTWAMQRITDSVVPTRWDNSRVPPTKTEMTTTQILKVRVVSASAKVRSGEPHDDRHDLQNSDVTSKVWTGVVPMRQVLDAPVTQQRADQPKVPQYVTAFIDERNGRNEKAMTESLIEP